jgi:integrase
MGSAAALPDAWALELDRYASWLSITVRSSGTVRLRLVHLRKLAREVAAPGPFLVTLDDLTDFLARQQWGASTLRSYGASLRSFYAWAVATGRIAESPAEGLPRVAFVPGKPRPAPEPAVRVGLAAADVRVRLMVRLAAQAGLRCCEIAKVHTGDLRGDLLGWSLLVHGKGGRERIVPLNEGLAAELRAHPEGYVFPGQIDGHLSNGHVSRLVSRALPEGVTAHPLRHRFGSKAFAGTKDIRAVQELLGHASVATTQIYVAVEDEALRRGVDAAA